MNSITDDELEMQELLIRYLENSFLIYPKFLFYFDCSFISYILKAVPQYDLQKGNIYLFIL